MDYLIAGLFGLFVGAFFTRIGWFYHRFPGRQLDRLADKIDRKRVAK